MLVYVIRHAESFSNVDASTGLNSGLTMLGEKQAQALAARLRNVPLRAVYSSPFARCIATAIPLADGLVLPIRVRPDLCEHHHLPPGSQVDLELDPMDRLVQRYTGLIACPDHPGPFSWVAGDEPFAGLVARMRGFATYLKGRWTGEDDAVVVVGHGSPIARLIEAWIIDRPGPAFRFIIDNCALTALRYSDGVSSLVCLNEVSHLRGLAAPATANYTAHGEIKPQPGSKYW